MSITTYNTTYFDDLSVADLNQKTPLDKNYLRILFKPGYSVQVRELNQLQSVLQTQIDRLGSSVYREGVAVHGGNCTFDVHIKTVDIELNSNYSETRLANVTHLKDALGLTAIVYSYEILPVEGTQTKVVRFYIRYNNSTQNAEDENIEIFPTEYIGNNAEATTNLVLEYDAEADDTDLTIGAVVSRGYAAAVFLSSGIFFVKGSFVHTPEQQIFFNYSEIEEDVKNQINGYAYLTYREYVVNYSSDSTLLDNANGTPNYSAPGADRYVIDLTVKFGDEEAFNAETNPIKLLTVQNSLVLDAVKEKYTDLDRTLARRTHEESGNYVVSPFNITVREFYNDLSNGGRYQYSEIPSDVYVDEDQPDDIIAKAKDLYSMSLDTGIAYVSGYRVESVDKQERYISKARGVAHISQTANLSSSANVGNYIFGSFSSTSILPTVQNALQTYTLRQNSDDIGTCRIRAVEPTNTSGTYALFLYDIVMNNTYKFSSTTSIINTSIGFSFIPANPGSVALLNTSDNKAMFIIPHSTVQNVSDLEYYVLRTVTISGNTYTLTDSAETFADSSNTLVRLNTNAVSTLSGTLSDGAKTITFNGGNTVTSACLKIKVKSGSGNSRLKTKTKTATTQTLSSIGNGVYRLPHTDVIRLVEARVGSSTGAIITQYCALTSDGQYATHYSNALVKYSGPALTPTTDIWFSYEYLLHGSGEYFTVNSYSTIDYSEIPSYDGIRLSDVYDFRPLILAGSSSSAVAAIDPNSVFEANIKYYLPRKDNVVVSPTGEFELIRGEASLNPIEPIVPRTSMLLYTLDIPAYTFSASDIKITPIDNRRYTMRDIGKLASRINNLEYYTSLSLLERNAMDKRVIDSESSTDRFKNGILVDSFYNHSSGDTANSGYACAVDVANGGLSPKQLAKSVPVKIVSSNNLREHAHGITLNYEERPLISQTYASETISVNPYDVAIFAGSLSLLPSTDDWKDTITAPDIIVNDTGAYDAMLLASQRNPNMFGTVASEWTFNWNGQPPVVTLGRFDRTRTPQWGGWRERFTTFTGTQTRDLITTSLGSETTRESLGENIIDTSYIPFMRSRKVYFTGNGLKPNTRVFAFFDNIDVTEYCNQLNGIPAINFDKIDDSDVELYTNINSTNTTFFKKQPLVTDASGKIFGEFIIPNNSIHKFKTGERTLRLTSSPRNITAEAETIANGNYIASGTTVTVQETILSITRPVVNTTVRKQTEAARRTTVDWFDPLAQTFIIPEIEEGIFATSVDIFFSQKSSTLPVTLQIVTVENGIPTQKVVPFSRVSLDASAVAIDPENGAVATNFRFSDPVYLRHGIEYAIVLLSNDSTYRVWIATVGGTNVITKTFISKNVYGGVFLTSQNASTWTPDQSKDLKFILNRAEFNMSGVVTHRSNIAGRLESITVNQNGAGTGYINAPTVTVAPPGVTATATAVVQNGTVTSFANLTGGSNYNAAPFVTISAPTGSGVKRQAKAVAFINSTGAVYKISTATADGGDPGTGYTDVPTVTVAPPGITATAIANVNPITNGISDIEVVIRGSNYRTAPAVTIAPPPSGTQATATANIEEVVFSGFNLNQTALVPLKTNLTNSINNSGETYNGVQLNTNYNLVDQYNITVEDQVLVTNTLTTSSPYVSPMLDIERKSIICFKNEINNINTDETSADAGGAIARYITKQVVLNNSSDQLNIYLDVNRPNSGTNIAVYIKFDDSLTWNLVQPIQSIPVNSDNTIYTETQYTATDSDNKFTKFTVKIVMLSDNPAFVPKVKDMRVIATI